MGFYGHLMCACQIRKCWPTIAMHMLWLPPPPSCPSSGPYCRHRHPLHHTQVSARSLPFPRVLMHAMSGIFASPATFSTTMTLRWRWHFINDDTSSTTTMMMTKLKTSRRGNRAHPGELSPITVPTTTSLSTHSRMTCHVTWDVPIIVHCPRLGCHVTTAPTSTDCPRLPLMFPSSSTAPTLVAMSQPPPPPPIVPDHPWHSCCHPLPPPRLPRHNCPHLHQLPLIAAHRHHRTQALPAAPPAAPCHHSTSTHTQSHFLWHFER